MDHDAAVVANNHKKALEFIEQVTRNADQVQKQVLSEILTINSQVQYLQQYGLHGRTDRETYKSVIPVATYEDLKPYIKRIADGDTSPILCGRPIEDFIISTGTSGGELKLFPSIDGDIERAWFARKLVMPVVNQYMADLDKGKGMYFMFGKPNAHTSGGLPICSYTARHYKSSHFKNRRYDPFEDYTSPDETTLCEDYYQSVYSQCLCGLYQNKLVLRIGCIFGYGMISIILFIRKHWALLVNDIRTGTINTEIVTDISVREAVKKIVAKPDPELADFIELECKRDESWKGIIARLWPNAKYIDTIITGTMSQHIPSIDFYSNDLPIVCARYACSECYLGINLNPLCKPNEVAYTLIPTMAYFEFLPILDENQQRKDKQEHQNDTQEPVDLVDVRLGSEYELLVTTYTGLYRYRVGDVLRVVGFKNTAPQFQYICREKVLLSIDCDKTSELDLQNAVQNAMNHLMSKFNASLVDYTSYADTSSTINPSHYVIYWELRHHSTKSATTTATANMASSLSVIPQTMFEECCLKMEESLNRVYKKLRTLDRSIGPLEIKIVETGTFDKLMDYAISQGSSPSQYKTPRCMKNVELLNSFVVSSYFSKEFPQFVFRK